MTKREIARLCFKVLALFLIVDFLGTDLRGLMWMVQGALTQVGSGLWLEGGLSLLASFTPVLKPAAAIWVWRRADVVAAWVFQHDIQDEPDEPDSPGAESGSEAGAPVDRTSRIDAETAQMVAFSTLGLWALIKGIAGVFGAITGTMMITRSRPEFADQSVNWASQGFVESVLCLALGFWLLFGTSGIVRLLKKVRDTGLEPGNRT